MNEVNSILKQILKAKENRASTRKKITNTNKTAISFTLNIPGYPKTNKLVISFFNLIIEELTLFLNANRIFLTCDTEIKTIDKAGNFYLTSVNKNPFSEKEIKLFPEQFEENHKLGRFLDIDITGKSGNNISSGKEKLCFYCKKFPAIVCMRNKNHTYTELREFIFNEIKNYTELYRKNKIIKNLSSIALKSLLYEVSLTPKPGLVDFNNSGSHTDMDFFTFIDSTSAIAPYFKELITAGYNFSSQTDLTTALPIIRNIGLKMEKDMFRETNKVNTQKGLIFLIGINLFASGFYFCRNERFEMDKYRKIIKNICRNITSNELENNKKPVSHGEICYQKYGLIGAGARNEAENGFPTVFNFALPVLEENLANIEFASKNKFNLALQKTLIAIIAVNNDTNILFRTGLKTLKKIQSISKEILNCDNFKDKFSDIIDFCQKENISPGGSADLLAITVYVFFMNQLKIKL